MGRLTGFARPNWIVRGRCSFGDCTRAGLEAGKKPVGLGLSTQRCFLARSRSTRRGWNDPGVLGQLAEMGCKFANLTDEPWWPPGNPINPPP